MTKAQTSEAPQLICRFCGLVLVRHKGAYVAPERTKVPIAKDGQECTKNSCLNADGYETLHDPIAA